MGSVFIRTPFKWPLIPDWPTFGKVLRADCNGFSGKNQTLEKTDDGKGQMTDDRIKGLMTDYSPAAAAFFRESSGKAH
jgi:hypothetical protein